MAVQHRIRSRAQQEEKELSAQIAKLEAELAGEMRIPEQAKPSGVSKGKEIQTGRNLSLWKPHQEWIGTRRGKRSKNFSEKRADENAEAWDGEFKEFMKWWQSCSEKIDIGSTRPRTLASGGEDAADGIKE